LSPNSRNAYMAGLMDGEGSFSIGVATSSKGRPHFGLHVRLYNTNRKMLQWAIANYGGNARWVTPKETNIKIKSDVRPMGQWWLTGREPLEKFLLGIIPYLVAKKEQAKIALEYIRMNGKQNPEARYELANRMSILNNTQDTPTTNTQDASEQSDLKIESELMGDHESTTVVTQIV
jgi:hypothetical protein